MQRAGKRIFSSFAAISLLLCFATTALWVRSYWVWDVVFWDRARGGFVLLDQRHLQSSRGTISYDLHVTRASSPFAVSDQGYGIIWYRFDLTNPAPSRYGLNLWERLGFVLHKYRTDLVFGVHGEYLTIGTPFWFLLVLFALPPGYALFRLRTNLVCDRSLAQGLCSSCGYDLRATPDRCPECGTIPPGKEAIVE
jgi:hypothetical protein